MRSLLTSAACIGLAVSTAAVPLSAQMQNNTEKQMSCDNGGYDSDHARHCEMREQTFPFIGRLTIDGVKNGGISVKGALRSDVLVRARVEASGDTQAAAASLAGRVSIDGSGGQVHAIGPEQANNTGWTVSYEIFVPQTTDLTLQTTNGGINISDVRGQLHFETKNGGVHLKRVNGDVAGSTVNGGVQVELAGNVWEGRQMEVSTHNGGVSLSMPAHFSAHVQTETGMGSVHSDFPLPQVANAGRNQKLDFNIGSGGPPIHITTGNGSINIKRADAQ